MKKIYLSLFVAGALTTVSNAQVSNENIEAHPAQIATEQHTAPRVDQMLSTSRDAGDTLWFDGFEDASLWNFIPPSGNPDPEVNGWSIGNVSISWTANVVDMNTEGNYARFVNGNPTVAPPTYIENGPFIFEYLGTIPDLTGVPAPHLEFEQSGARFLTHQAVQVSVDGGSTWITVGSNDDIDPLTSAGGAPYPNPMTRRFYIGDAIAGAAENVMVRLFWDGAQNGPEFNYIEYGWHVDNIRIVEGSSYDLSISNTSYDGFDVDNSLHYGDLPYSIYPTSQLRPISFSAMAVNSGSITQDDITLVVTITDEAENEVAVLESDPVTLNEGESTSISISGYNLPSEVGTYYVNMELSSEAEDTTPEDNIGDELTFSISEGVYARDRGARAGQFTNFDDNYVLGNMFYVENSAEIHCLGVALSDESVSETFFAIEVRGDNLTDYIGETESMFVPEASQLNATGGGNFLWSWMLGGGSINMAAGTDFFVGLSHYGGDDDVILALSGTSPDQTSFFFEGSEETWYYVTSTPMVRIGLTQEFCQTMISSSVEVVEQLTNHNLYPNPATDRATLEYNLLETSAVKLMAFDNMGRVVYQEDKGNQPVGEYRFDLDLSHLASGMYTFTIFVNEKPVNKKLIVE